MANDIDEPAKTKGGCDDLAIFGGQQAFDFPLHVNKPNVGKRKSFDKHIDQIWESRWFTNNGKLSVLLESEIKDRLGVRHCVSMSNGTAAMTVLLEALALSGEVILPSFTFISTAHCLRLKGLTPIFCDIDPVTGNLDHAQCEALITPRTSAIIATHLWGRPCGVEALQKMADDHEIQLVFDAAHAFGCTIGGESIGNFGTAEVFSFNATKAFHCGEGGAITCTDDALAEKLRAIRNFGFTDFDYTEYLGTNAKLPEISAALGLTNLEVFDSLVERNRQTYHLFRRFLNDIDAIQLFDFDESESNNYHYVSLLLSDACALTRDDIIALLHAENILARRYFHPGNHKMEPYRTLYPNAGKNLPVTEDFAKRVIVLPAGSCISETQVQDICDLLRFVVENDVEIESRLHSREKPRSHLSKIPMARR